MRGMKKVEKKNYFSKNDLQVFSRTFFDKMYIFSSEWKQIIQLKIKNPIFYLNYAMHEK